MPNESLWPDDLFTEKLVAPVLILKEQASHLSAASGRSVLGKIVTGRDSQDRWNSDDENADVIHYFQLEVPEIGGYTFDLFKVRHQPRSLYPVFIDSHLNDERFDPKIDDEAEFRSAIKEIFSSRETIAIIRTLRAQTEDPETLPPKPPSVTPDEDDHIPF